MTAYGVSTASMICMAVSFCISMGMPVVLFVVFRKRCGLKAVPVLLGIAGFVLFALILEQVLHSVVLAPDAYGRIALLDQPVLFMLYGGFAAGLFEETARLLIFKLLKKKYTGFGTALSYGIGHGGVEAIILVGLSMVSNLIAAVFINRGEAGALLTTAQINTLITVQPWMFLMSGLERILAMGIHISLSVLVFYAVHKTGRFWLYPLAITLHAVCNFPAALMQVGILNNILAVEGLTFIMVCVLVFVAVRVYKHCKEEVPETVIND